MSFDLEFQNREYQLNVVGVLNRLGDTGFHVKKNKVIHLLKNYRMLFLRLIP